MAVDRLLGSNPGSEIKEEKEYIMASNEKPANASAPSVDATPTRANDLLLAMQAQMAENGDVQGLFEPEGEQAVAEDIVADPKFLNFARVRFGLDGVGLTIRAVEACEEYKLAKSFLAEGKLEECIASAGGMLTSLMEHPSCNSNDLFPPLAPIYYPYGTALLDTVEEASDTQVSSEGGGKEVAEDLEIAWENLETARAILGGAFDVQEPLDEGERL